MPAASSGLHWIAGGAVAAVALPALAIGVGMPFWIAGGISLLAGGGVAAVMAPRKMFAQLDSSGAERSKIEFARELLMDAEPDIARMEEAAGEIKAQKVAARVRHLVKIARDILVAIERDPLRIDRVRRFLTYYLPRSAEIAESFIELERGVAPDAERLAATTEMFERLDRAFTQYASDLQDADLDKLDIELKLLKSSLDEDLGPDVRSAAPIEQGKGKTQGKA